MSLSFSIRANLATPSDSSGQGLSSRPLGSKPSCKASSSNHIINTLSTAHENLVVGMLSWIYIGGLTLPTTDILRSARRQ